MLGFRAPPARKLLEISIAGLGGMEPWFCNAGEPGISTRGEGGAGVLIDTLQDDVNTAGSYRGRRSTSWRKFPLSRQARRARP